MSLEETKKYLEAQLVEFEHLITQVDSRRKTVKIKAAINSLRITRDHITRKIFQLKENMASPSLVLERELYDPILEYWTRQFSMQKSEE